MVEADAFLGTFVLTRSAHVFGVVFAGDDVGVVAGSELAEASSVMG